MDFGERKDRLQILSYAKRELISPKINSKALAQFPQGLKVCNCRQHGNYATLIGSEMLDSASWASRPMLEPQPFAVDDSAQAAVSRTRAGASSPIFSIAGMLTAKDSRAAV